MEPKAVACDECDTWYHTECMGMTNSVYDRLSNNSVSWQCTACDQPNHSSIVYNSITVSANSFSRLTSISSSEPSQLNLSTSDSVVWSPKNTSSPKPRKPPRRTANNFKSLRFLVVNFQSIKNKGPEFQVLIENSNPDVIFTHQNSSQTTTKSEEGTGNLIIMEGSSLPPNLTLQHQMY